MRERATGAKDYWTNLLTFRADYEAERDETLADIDQKVRFGSLAPEQAEAAREAAEETYQSQLSELGSGPTSQLIESEYQAQREFAEEEHRIGQSQAEAQFYRDNPRRYRVSVRRDREEGGGFVSYSGAQYIPARRNSGDIGDRPAYYIDSRGNRIRGQVAGAQQTSPDFQPTPFSFASTADEYFGNLFGTEAAPVNPARAPAAPEARMRAGTSSEEGIGVGQVYSWY